LFYALIYKDDVVLDSNWKSARFVLASFGLDGQGTVDIIRSCSRFEYFYEWQSLDRRIY
jgi:hypothetical protein